MNARSLLWNALVPALLAASLGLAQAADPVVSNLTAVQRPGTRLVDISYTVTADTPTVTVSLEVSVDGGTTWSVPVTATSGDIGSNIAVGTGKAIVWDAGVDWNNQYSAQTRYRVTADDGRVVPSITTHPASGIIDSGQTATLTVIATGTGPLTYQWYQGTSGTTTTAVGTNSSSFTTPALTMPTSYWVRISNAVGTANSNTATVSVTETMVLIPAGSFTMGRTSGDTDSNAPPPVTVNVSAFYMAKHEVTKALWDEVRAWGLTNGYTDLPAGDGKAANHPVNRINWYAMVKWCNARSEKEGLTCAYYRNTAQTTVYRTGDVNVTNAMVKWNANGYRVPTEAEWEKAARGGVSGKRFPWGTDTISHNEANFRNSGGESYASGTTGFHPTYNDGTTPYTSPVGSFGANGYGLHDMAGNVWEWCWDWYSELYTNGATDPRGPASGSSRVYRGGSWGNDAIGCRVAVRGGNSPGPSSNGKGFRLARSSVP